jgi:hypothetical protein
MLCLCAFALGSVLAAFFCTTCASNAIAAKDEDHHKDTKRLHDEVAYWKAQAARYRASLDGASDYRATFPRPLNRK